MAAPKGSVRPAEQTTSTPARHARYIPEPERGWKIVDERGKDRLGLMRGGGGNSVSSSNGGTGNSTGSSTPRRTSSFLHFGSLWQTSRAKLQSTTPSHAESVTDDEDDEEEEETHYFTHGRERSNSMPTSPVSEDVRSFFTVGEDLDVLPSRSSTVKRKSLQLPPSTQDLTDPHELEEPAPILTPSVLSRLHSKTPSLSATRDATSRHTSRGYPWRKDVAVEGFIHPSHRNPTSKQAFYDTHFGSSSGFRSVAGLADGVFHPFEQSKLTLGRWVTSMRKDRVKSKGAIDMDEPKGDSLLSWTALNSLGLFGASSSSKVNGAKNNGQEETSSSSNLAIEAYEPELIPTIQRDSHAHRYFKNLHGNVVVLGGYRGSILRDAETHQMMWVPLKVGVGLRRPTLELGLTREAEDRSEERVIADEMLGGIGNMIDMGRRLLNRCTSKRTRVHSFGYDWRLNLARSSQRLEAFLLELWEKSAERGEERQGAKVVAHSMGGLVALHALARTNRPEIFNSLVFASTPFLGTANILGPFRFGDAALLNDEICSPRATFSFRSSFYLLPVDPDPSEDDEEGLNTRGGRCFEEEDGTPHDLDYLDADTWNDLGFSPCVDIGRRKEILEKSKRRAENQGRALGKHLERSASLRQEHMSNTGTEDKDRSAAARVGTFPGPDIQLIPSAESASLERTSSSSTMIEKAANAGFSGAAKMGQAALAGTGTTNSNDDTRETLQPANQQERRPEIQAKNNDENTLSEKRQAELLEDEASAAWLYLEDTLAETKKFFNDLRTGFNEDLHRAGRYPPMAILTSGRTPTVRGALVAQSANRSQAADAWKEGVREGDYSRMLYAPGDGVILRRSAVTLPGRWGNLLVRGNDDDVNALTNHEGVVETSHRHITLLSDVDGIGRCLEACRRAQVDSNK